MSTPHPISEDHPSPGERAGMGECQCMFHLAERAKQARAERQSVPVTRKGKP
jgi:hypothetical protein